MFLIEILSKIPILKLMKLLNKTLFYTFSVNTMKTIAYHRVSTLDQNLNNVKLQILEYSKLISFAFGLTV